MREHDHLLDRRVSKREAEVMVLLCDGLRQKTIASRLDVSPKTIQTHIGRVMGKLGARTVAHAAVLFSHKPGELEYRSWIAT